MVGCAAAVPGCACPVDAGRCTPEGDSGSATDPSRRVPACAAGRAQTGAGVVESTIYAGDPQHLVLNLDLVPRPQLAAAALLALAVDEHGVGGEEGGGLAARVDQAGQLEQLAEPDHLAADLDLALHVRPPPGCAPRRRGRRGPSRR